MWFFNDENMLQVEEKNNNYYTKDYTNKKNEKN